MHRMHDIYTYIYIYFDMYMYIYIRHIKKYIIAWFHLQSLEVCEPVVVTSNVSGKGCRLRCRWDLGTRTSKKWEFQQGMLHGMPRCTLIKALWNSRPEAAPPETTPEKPKARIVLFFSTIFLLLPMPYLRCLTAGEGSSQGHDTWAEGSVFADRTSKTSIRLYMNIYYINMFIYIYSMYWIVWNINLCHNAIVHKRAQAKPKEAAKASDVCCHKLTPRF